MIDPLAPHHPYDPSILDEALEMVRLGATISELADHFVVPIASVQLWAACHREFAAALRVGRAEADDRVERMLYERAVGYTFDSEKVFCSEGLVTRVPTREHCPPDVAAARAWLYNRRGETWRDHPEHVVNLDLRVERVERVIVDHHAAADQDCARLPPPA